MTAAPQLLLAYYGDDFTGSTDALESLSRAGARTALFIAPPSARQLARHPGLHAAGVAGLARSMPPAEMETELRPAFAALRALRAPHVHYKVCSTFDSSPAIGSIGRAIDIGAETFRAPFVPLLVGTPALGRWCVFGNLFARMGTGGGGAIHRLDRHPSMSRHPVTPADESDLRLHLSRQTKKRIALFDILHVALPAREARAALDALLGGGGAPEIVLFDVLETRQLARIGALLDAFASPARPLFSAGSSAIETALAAHWTEQGRLPPPPSWPDPGPARPLLVMSGSCSPVTGAQVAWALANGFADVPLDAAALAAAAGGSGVGGSGGGSGVADAAVETAIRAVIRHLQAGRHVVAHTCPREGDAPPGPAGSAAIGAALGRIARAAFAAGAARRLVIAGGDTSSHAARALGIEAVEMLAPLAPGAPLCRARAPGSPLD
ncbi:MAG: four-carbon acid sugar kinase family protein, partial [Opitutaceae bacterium]|nr:four-carbon acid sugar kinase family protein [Opitutaceae bacterium]